MRFKLALSQIGQKISGLFFFNNTIEQKLNCFENEEIIDDYFKDKFLLIENHFNNNEIEEVENILNDICLKKEKFNSDVEISLLKYKALIYLIKNDNNNMEIIVEKLKKMNGSKYALQEIKFNLAIRKGDYYIFNELKEEWLLDNKDIKKININEIKFLFLSRQYKKVIEKVDEDIYKSNKDIMNILAMSLSFEGRYDEAENIINEIKVDSDEYKLSWIYNEFNKYFSKIKYYGDVEDIDTLVTYVEEINKINKINLNKQQIKQLDILLLRGLYFTNVSEAEKKFRKLQENYKDDFEISILGIDILEKVNKSDEAEKIAEYILNLRKDITIIYRILIIKSRKEKWKEVIDIYNSNNGKVDDIEGLCRYLYGLALIEIYGTQIAYKIMKYEICENTTLDLLLLARINVDNKEKCEQILDDICNRVDSTDLIRIDICDLYLNINNYKKAYICLKEGAHIKNIFLKKLITISIEKEYNYQDILDIYHKRQDLQNNTYINSNIYYIALKLNNYRYAYYISEKIYKAENNSFWINEYIRMKLINEEFEGLESLVKLIDNINQSEYIITAAEVYAYFQDYQRSNELSYRAFYYLDKCNNKIDILNRINAISLKLFNLESSEKANEKNKDKVKLNDIVTLKNKDNYILKICLNEEIYYQKDKCIMDINHIKMNDILWIELMGKSVGDTLKINEVEYKVTNIINKISYMYRIAFQNRIDNSEGDEIKQISIQGNSKEQLNLDEMKNVLRESNKKVENVIDMYMKQENGIGVPVYFIRNDKELLKELLESLMYSKDTGIIAGKSVVVSRNSKVVLTLVSIIILELNSLLDDFLNFYDVYIGDRVINEIDNIIKILVSKYNKKDISLYLIEDKLVVDEKNKDYKIKRINFYRGILSKLEKATKIEKSIVNSALFIMPEVLVKSFDIQSIEIANELKASLVIDDYFYARLAQSVYNNIDIFNTGGFVATMVCENYNKYIKLAEKLIVERYQYVFNLETLAHLLLNMKVDTKKSRDKFIKLINKLLENDINGYYQSVLRDICLILCFKLKIYQIVRRKIDIIMNCVNLKK
ncbi:PIN domain-containing protein [uncultured Clostridium sp.]|uniref:PIN domain-containing protein n=1 Tax=uncultured Clostridium sp. TaxID=59620 RepID=UPI00262E43D2|nr:hypothetical protein [uncultured Clostridium sp.]